MRLVSFFISFFLISVSCTAESRTFCSEDLGIIRTEDNSVIMLEMSVDAVIALLGDPIEVEITSYNEGEIGQYDKFQIKYEGISFWYFRGFEIIYQIVITNSSYKSIAGFKIGDNLLDVKKTLSGLKEYDGFAILSFFDGTTERGFGIDYDQYGIINKLTLSVFSP